MNGEVENMQATPETDAKVDAAEDRWSRLEKLVRSMGRDSLTLTRGQQEAQAALNALAERLDQLDLAVKGVSQTAWRAAQERLGAAQEIEKHFATALRELEKRIQDELRWQIQRNALLAIFPALDDMARVLGHQRELAGRADDPFFEAMELVQHKILEGLRALDLEEIRVESGVTRFDPQFHEAVEDSGAAGANHDGVAAGTIVLVKRRGYMLGGRVFRAPQVVVKS